ncbi:hypothetical protein KQX54_021003 [Cotesia glomerata]|uniref:Uncharacterized protein n=1 Tax=Cotesia glomerata TaxID=32391 RepID=A0AAV7IEU8_COTGL|nr:hypothetical protein KQX54_021003 [Cotesia glomerata]
MAVAGLVRFSAVPVRLRMTSCTEMTESVRKTKTKPECALVLRWLQLASPMELVPFQLPTVYSSIGYDWIAGRVGTVGTVERVERVERAGRGLEAAATI